MKQRIFAILLSLTMMFTLVPTAWALSEEENQTPAPRETSENGEGAEGSGSVAPEMSGDCGKDGSENSVKWALTQNNTDNENPRYTLTISGSGDMADYESPTNTASSSIAPWYIWKDSINKLEIKSGVSAIGAYAFYGLEELQTVTFEGTTLEMVGGHKKVISYFLRNGVASVTPFPVSAVLPQG